jgi:EmrB/QacA subfamily drug resistance transporter
MAQMMVALDATVINIALPSAQHGLHATGAERQWLVTAYTLALAGLLLVGGRLSDLVGRRRTFLVGLVGFAAASAAGGAAPSFAALIVTRAAQGGFAALLMPTALSILAVTFTEAKERAKAFAIFGAIAGTGGAVGLLLGGILTQYLSWRWCLYINVPVAAATFVLGVSVLPRTAPVGGQRIDLVGAATVSAGLIAVVYGLSNAATHGWSSPTTVAVLAAGAVLLATFVIVEGRVEDPLVPLPILAERNRGGSSLAIGLTVIALYGMFLLLTYEFQVVLGYSPVRAGVAFLPLSGAVMASSTTMSRVLLPKLAPRLLMMPGLLVAGAGMATLALLSAGSSYIGGVLPAELLVGLGVGAVFVPAFSTATVGVAPQRAGVASALANTSQQVGASVGTALLNTIATSATAAYLAAHVRSPTAVTHALVHGYATAAGWAATILTAAAVIVGLLVNAGPPASESDSSDPESTSPPLPA